MKRRERNPSSTKLKQKATEEVLSHYEKSNIVDSFPRLLFSYGTGINH